MRTKSITISILVPAYNESKTLARTVAKLSRLSVKGFYIEVIVVDDGSTDQTKKLCKKLQKVFPKIIFINSSINRGKGSAIILGLKVAKGSYIAVHDADDEYNPKSLEEMLCKLKESPVDIAVYGSRNLHLQNQKGSFFFYYGGVFLSKLANVLFNVNLTDIATAQKVFPKYIADDLKEQGFGFCYELTALLAKKYKLPIIEIPVEYKPRTKQQGKKISYFDGLKAMLILIKNFFKVHKHVIL